MNAMKVVVSHRGTHYHKLGCVAVDNPSDYYEIEIKDLPNATNDHGSKFRPCPMCYAEEYGKRSK